MRNASCMSWMPAAIVVLAACAASAGEDRTELTIRERRPEAKAEPAPAQSKERDEAPAAKPETSAAEKKSERKPDAEAAGTVEFLETPASHVLAFISERAGVNIVTDPACAEKLKTPVTFKAKGMTCRQLLDWTVRLSGTGWVLADGAIFVTSQENIPKPEDPAEALRKFLEEHPEFSQEPAQFEEPPEIGFPKGK